jgi:hypothetical protein
LLHDLCEMLSLVMTEGEVYGLGGVGCCWLACEGACCYLNKDAKEEKKEL